MVLVFVAYCAGARASLSLWVGLKHSVFRCFVISECHLKPLTFWRKDVSAELCPRTSYALWHVLCHTFAVVAEELTVTDRSYLRKPRASSVSSEKPGVFS